MAPYPMLSWKAGSALRVPVGVGSQSILGFALPAVEQQLSFLGADTLQQKLLDFFLGSYCLPTNQRMCKPKIFRCSQSGPFQLAFGHYRNHRTTSQRCCRLLGPV